MSKMSFIAIIETVYREARKGRGLIVSPKDYSTKYCYWKMGPCTTMHRTQTTEQAPLLNVENRTVFSHRNPVHQIIMSKFV